MVYDSMGDTNIYRQNVLVGFMWQISNNWGLMSFRNTKNMCVLVYQFYNFLLCPYIVLPFFPLLHMQSVMPEDALVEAWSKSAHKLWVRRLRRTSYLTELLQVYFIISFSYYHSGFFFFFVIIIIILKI